MAEFSIKGQHLRKFSLLCCWALLEASVKAVAVIMKAFIALALVVALAGFSESSPLEKILSELQEKENEQDLIALQDKQLIDPIHVFDNASTVVTVVFVTNDTLAVIVDTDFCDGCAFNLYLGGTSAEVMVGQVAVFTNLQPGTYHLIICKKDMPLTCATIAICQISDGVFPVLNLNDVCRTLSKKSLEKERGLIASQDKRGLIVAVDANINVDLTVVGVTSVSLAIRVDADLCVGCVFILCLEDGTEVEVLAGQVAVFVNLEAATYYKLKICKKNKPLSCVTSVICKTADNLLPILDLSGVCQLISKKSLDRRSKLYKIEKLLEELRN